MREFVAAMMGALRLARFDRGGMAFFDSSDAGFWRSFTAAWIAAPAYTVMVLARLRPWEVDAVRLVLVEGIGYVISWFLWPLVMISVARLLDCSERYRGYIVAYNWATLVQYIVVAPVTLLAFGGELGGFGPLLSFIVFAYTLAYSGFIAGVALGVPLGMAVGIVVLDVIVTLFVEGITDGMLPIG